MNILIKNGHVIDPANKVDEKLDVLISDGKIAKLRKTGSVPANGAEVIDASGKLVVPGLIDMHVHLREPGFEYKETIATGTDAAKAGGFTAVCCMPNTNPAIDDESVVRYIHEKGKTVCDGIVDVYPVAAATKGREGKELSPMAELANAGAVGFTDDGAPIANAEVMRRVLEYSSMYGIPVIQHAEESSMTHGGSMHEGFASTRFGLPGIPSVAEELMIARDVILLGYAPKARYHVAHVSTSGSLDIIRRAKSAKLNITCEVTPHHFTLTDEAVADYDTNTKMNPPLRTMNDVQAMKEGLKDGTIDVIASDHAPHTIDEKEVEYAQAPFGIVGLETTIGLAISELVAQKFLTLYQLVEKLSTNPRNICSLPKIRIEAGERANLTLIDPEAEWTVDCSALHSKSKNSPFHGRRLRGRAIGIVNNGKYLLPY